MGCIVVQCIAAIFISKMIQINDLEAYLLDGDYDELQKAVVTQLLHQEFQESAEELCQTHQFSEIDWTQGADLASQSDIDVDEWIRNNISLEDQQQIAATLEHIKEMESQKTTIQNLDSQVNYLREQLMQLKTSEQNKWKQKLNDHFQKLMDQKVKMLQTLIVHKTKHQVFAKLYQDQKVQESSVEADIQKYNKVDQIIKGLQQNWDYYRLIVANEELQTKIELKQQFIEETIQSQKNCSIEDVKDSIDKLKMEINKLLKIYKDQREQLQEKHLEKIRKLTEQKELLQERDQKHIHVFRPKAKEEGNLQLVLSFVLLFISIALSRYY